MVGDVPTLVGTDGQAKMSKSLNNTIYLGEEPAAVKKKVMRMYTDPKRVRADVPGTVEGNPVFIYHDAFNPNKAEIEDLKTRYRAGKVGDVEVKEKLATAINNMLTPMHERRAKYEESGLIEEIIYNGTLVAREETQKTLYAMKKAMGLSGVCNRVRRKVEKRQKKQKARAS
jgi:tryptophanyl-tRNA synthetase